jgi:hypothetical protein
MSESRREERAGKRPYEPPSVRSEPIFETTALACAKIAGNAKCTTMGTIAS